MNTTSWAWNTLIWVKGGDSASSSFSAITASSPDSLAFGTRFARSGATWQHTSSCQPGPYSAAEYGPGWQLEVCCQVAPLLAKRVPKAKLSGELAVMAEKLLDAESPPFTQIKVFQAQEVVFISTERTADAKRVKDLLDRLEPTVVKSSPFPGRKGDSSRVVVLELFTGAQCPPCVAADLAFGGLEQRYKSSDVVMMQYHLHIPGPDPMTNSDTEARWKHYRDALGKQQIAGVPTAVINGKPLKGGGGPITESQRLYERYVGAIDASLESEGA